MSVEYDTSTVPMDPVVDPGPMRVFQCVCQRDERVVTFEAQGHSSPSRHSESSRVASWSPHASRAQFEGTGVSPFPLEWGL